jgi:HSP20 family protein
MALRDLMPWSHNGSHELSRSDPSHPFHALHREMNRLFDDAFRSFDVSSFASAHTMSWPNMEVSETDQEMKVTAELPGLEEKDVKVELAHGTLSISGERKTETEDKERRFSERYYGRFERRIAVEDVDADKITASFKNGVLTVTLPKSPAAQQNVKRIAINRQ